MAKHSVEYQLECVGHLELFNEKKEKKEPYFIGEVQINNVRELVDFLNISSYSLYKWKKDINYLGRNMDVQDKKDDLMTKEKELMKEFDKDFHDYPEETYKNFGEQNSERNLEEHDLTVIDGISILKKQMEDIGYWQSLARALGLKNYRQKTAQIKLRIGTHLINGTGLVETQKNVRKELKMILKDDFTDDLEKYEKENFGSEIK